MLWFNGLQSSGARYLASLQAYNVKKKKMSTLPLFLRSLPSTVLQLVKASSQGRHLCYLKHCTASNHVPQELSWELLYTVNSAFRDCQHLHSAVLWKEINVRIDWNGSKQLRMYYNCAERSSEWSCCLRGNEKGTACSAAKYIYFLTVEIICLNEAQAAVFPNYEGQWSTLHWMLHSWEFYHGSQRKLHMN